MPNSPAEFGRSFEAVASPRLLPLPSWASTAEGVGIAERSLKNFSSERLMRLLTRLGQDVEIVVKSKPRRRQRGRIRVVEEARA